MKESQIITTGLSHAIITKGPLPPSALDIHTMAAFSKLQKQVEAIDAVGVKDRCCICGQDRSLTKEHTPSRKAFNEGSTQSRLYSSKGIDFTNPRKMKFTAAKTPGGAWHKTLCSSCNGGLESIYSPAYIALCQQAAPLVGSSNSGDHIQGEMSGLLGRTARQALIYLCATSQQGLCEIYPSLRNYLRQPSSNKFPENMKLFLFCLSGKSLRGYSSGVIASFNYKTRKGYLMADFVHWPFGWRLVIGKVHYRKATEVTDWCKTPENESITRDIKLYCHELQTEIKFQLVNLDAV